MPSLASPRAEFVVEHSLLSPRRPIGTGLNSFLSGCKRTRRPLLTTLYCTASSPSLSSPCRANPSTAWCGSTILSRSHSSPSTYASSLLDHPRARSSPCPMSILRRVCDPETRRPTPSQRNFTNSPTNRLDFGRSQFSKPDSTHRV
jgi:hypothetical protein